MKYSFSPWPVLVFIIFFSGFFLLHSHPVQTHENRWQDDPCKISASGDYGNYGSCQALCMYARDQYRKSRLECRIANWEDRDEGCSSCMNAWTYLKICEGIDPFPGDSPCGMIRACYTPEYIYNHALCENE